MVSIVVVKRAALLIARRASTWTIDQHLGEQSSQCVEVDPRGTGSSVLRNCACRSLPQPRQRPELGTGRTGHRPPDGHRG
jgi:hypothetical protein